MPKTSFLFVRCCEDVFAFVNVRLREEEYNKGGRYGVGWGGGGARGGGGAVIVVGVVVPSWLVSSVYLTSRQTTGLGRIMAK